MDLSTAIDRARAASEDGDARAVIRELLEAWRAAPAPGLARALERLTKDALPAEAPSFEEAAEDILEAGRYVDRLRSVNAATATGLIAKLRVKEDPRVAAAAMRLVEDPPWHATGSMPFWTKLFALLDANADPRSAARLAKVDYAEVINGKSMRTWMQEKVAKALSAQKGRGPKPARLSKEEQAALDRIAVKARAATPAARPKARSSEAELFRAVYEDPDDDGARAVLADFLIERGDPRGELISLQLAPPTPEGEKRALQLVRKHQKAWLGALAPYVKYLAYPSVDAEDPLRIQMWWRRGFVAGCLVAITKPKLIELASSPTWSTLERISSVKGAEDDPAWEKAVARLFEGMRALRHIDRTDPRGLAIAAKVPRTAARLERVSMLVRSEPLGEVNEHLRALESLRSLAVTIGWDEQPKLAPLLAGRLLDRLDHLRAHTRAGDLRLHRAPDGRGHSLVVSEPRAEMHRLVAELAGAGAKVTALAFDKARPEHRRSIGAVFPEASTS